VNQIDQCYGGYSALLQTAPASDVRAHRGPTQKWRRGAVAVLCALSVSSAGVAPAWAQSLIRDTETDALLSRYARPILQAANLTSVRMRVVCQEDFNAFVFDGRNVFVSTGLLKEARTPNEVIGVIAHEIGHISGGHIMQLRNQVERMQAMSLLFGILGIAAMAASVASGGDTAREMGGLGTGIMLGGQNAAVMSFLAERRAQESAADQAAMGFLEATKQSGRGMLETFERFAGAEYVSETHRSPFQRTHPVAVQRLAQLRERVARSPHAGAVDKPELQAEHDLVKAKVTGYLYPLQHVLGVYPTSNQSLPARYARAIARNCSGRCSTKPGSSLELECSATAIHELDALVREQPRNPYFLEAKGFALFQATRFKEALEPLRKAVELTGGRSPLIQAQLARALVRGGGDRAQIDEAISLLGSVIRAENENAEAYRLRGEAHSKRGDEGRAYLDTADYHYYIGNSERAAYFAKLAQTKLPKGTPEWQRAQDVISLKPSK